jgi:hypothetical protein
MSEPLGYFYSILSHRRELPYMTQPAETPKPDQDAGLIAGVGVEPEWIIIRVEEYEELEADLALRDRQLAGLVEALTRIRHASPKNTNSGTARSMSLWTKTVAAEALRSLETEGET